MSERDRYARSFGSVADDYEANRPAYADTAVDWIASRLPLREVLDLGAGTGKLTRQLLERGSNVVAVEPDPDMRATFTRVLPQVTILDGNAEAIPLPEGSVDTVTVGQAFHWFDMHDALGEMHRVTRPGGGFALLWNRWAEEDPILSAIDALLDAHRPAQAPWHEESLSGRFGSPEERTFAQTWTMTPDQIEGWAASTSGFVNAARDEQERLRSAIRAIVPAPAVDVVVSTLVVVAHRV